MCNCKGARSVAPRAAPPPAAPRAPRVRAIPAAPVPKPAPAPKPVRSVPAPVPKPAPAPKPARSVPAPVPKPARSVPAPVPKPITAISAARRPLPNFSRGWAISTGPTRTKSGLIAYTTALWGPSLWRALHTAAEIGNVEKFAAVAAALDGALPCPDCEKHYHQWYITHPVPTERAAIRTWLLDLHNDVNRRSHKTPWTLEQVAAAYGGDGAAVAAAAALTTAETMVGPAVVAALRAALA